MRHFPIYLDLDSQTVVISGAGETAVAKLRLLLKTNAKIFVYGTNPDKLIQSWARAGKLSLIERQIRQTDIKPAKLFYCANDDETEDLRALALAHKIGVLTNVVDDLQNSDFITPAMVDRAPLTIAIGTEGAAPVLARQIKKQLEDTLPTELGPITRIAQNFRKTAANLPHGRKRRAFWSQFYSGAGVAAYRAGGARAVLAELRRLYQQTMADTPAKQGAIWIMGTGNNTAEMLTLKAHTILHDADVVIYDALVGSEFLELARREAVVIPTGRLGVARPLEITQTAIKSAQAGMHVVRLISGDVAGFEATREAGLALDTLAVQNAGVMMEIVPNVAVNGANNVNNNTSGSNPSHTPPSPTIPRFNAPAHTHHTNAKAH